MTDKKYWIWLSAALGQGARTDELLSAYTNPEEVFNDDRRARMISGVFTKAKLDRLESASITDAENTVRICEKNGWKIYTPDDDDYPARLRSLRDMPLVLFVSGDITCLKDRLAVGVVGTRNPSYESVKITKRIAGDLALADAAVISGGALGIDSAAHEGALESGGFTVCVLGCGLGTGYLNSNEKLRGEISKHGAVVTEYPPFSPASRQTFPIRNRIISGMSHGVLVVEAGEKSGSLITANCATEQGRDLFAVPGNILSSSYTGTNKLIKDGAGAVTDAQDIIRPLTQIYGFSSSRVSREEKKPVKASLPSVSPDALAVYKLLQKQPMHPDEICAECNLTPAKVLSALMELEISGLAEQTEGKKYIPV